MKYIIYLPLQLIVVINLIQDFSKDIKSIVNLLKINYILTIINEKYYNNVILFKHFNFFEILGHMYSLKTI